MIASLVRARGKGGKFVSKSQLNSATQKLNDANKNNNGQPQVKRKYNKRLKASEPEIPKETEIKTGESDVEIDSDDENTVYLFPQETELADNRQQTETMPQRKGDVLRSQAVKPTKKDDVTLIKGKPTHYMTEMRPPVTTPLTLDCDSTNSRSSPTHGLMGPPASTPFTNLRNSVSRPGKFMPCHLVCHIVLALIDFSLPMDYVLSILLFTAKLLFVKLKFLTYGMVMYKTLAHVANRSITCLCCSTSDTDISIHQISCQRLVSAVSDRQR